MVWEDVIHVSQYYVAFWVAEGVRGAMAEEDRWISARGWGGGCVAPDSARSVDGRRDGEMDLMNWFFRVASVFINCLVGIESGCCGCDDG